MIELDEAVRSNLERSQAGREWMAGLDATLANLQSKWGFQRLGAPYAGGSHSLVAPVVLNDGVDAVLKVPFLDEENRHEAQALLLYDGDGAVQLIAFDPQSGSMLLERATPGDPLEDAPDRDDAIVITCRLLRRLRRAAPPDHPFALVADVARAWSVRLRAHAATDANPTARRLLSTAAVLASDLSGNSEPHCLVNRDAHLGNILAAQREPWLLVDPKPLVGEAAFDSGYLVDWLIGDKRTPDQAQMVIGVVADALGVSQHRVSAWSMVRAMENYLWSVAEHDDPNVYLETAAAIAEAGIA